jgi:hypothetical protein
MCPIGFLMLGSTRQDLPSDPPAACRSACRRRQASLRTGSPQRTILACTRPILVGHAVELATAHHLPRRRPGPNRTSASPAPPAPASSTRLPTQADHEPGMDTAGDHADPAIPAVRLPAPPPRSRTSLRPDTADTATHKHRTPTPDAGQRSRTADTWTLRRPHRTLDTGHRTPDTGRGRGQVTTARPASGPPEPPRRATARWDAQPCSCGRRLRRSAAHAGSAVRPPSSAR